MPALPDEYRLIESAAFSISGAALLGDVAYARLRHDELLGALSRLQARGADVAALRGKAQAQLRACQRGSQPAAARLALDLVRMLSFLSRS